MRTKNAVSWAILVILLTALYLIFSNLQSIIDWSKLRNYVPPEKIVQLADSTTMRPETRRVFYVNHPQLNDKAEFNTHCRKSEHSIVLGCFISNQGIFLLDVKDQRLDGVVEVTAAHETLHALYDRLSSKERERVDKLTTDFFNQIQDERIKKTIESYRAEDPKIVPNELHSIIGTEIKDLPSELEAYYSRYFSNRKQIAAFSEQYEHTFIDLRNQVQNIDDELDSLKQQIDDNQAELIRRNEELEEQRKELDRLLSDNNAEAYNARVADFNQLVSSYNRLINTTRQLVSRYNQMVEERNSLATAEQELVEAIDSRSIPNEKAQ